MSNTSEFIHRGRTYLLVQQTDEEHSYSMYSKSWHRQYGPHITITERRGAMWSKRPDGTSTAMRTVVLDSFRGNWQRRTVEAILPNAVASYDEANAAHKAAQPPPPARIRRSDLRAAGACDESITKVLRALSIIAFEDVLNAKRASWLEDDIHYLIRQATRMARPDDIAPYRDRVVPMLRRAGYHETADLMQTLLDTIEEREEEYRAQLRAEEERREAHYASLYA